MHALVAQEVEQNSSNHLAKMSRMKPCRDHGVMSGVLTEVDVREVHD